MPKNIQKKLMCAFSWILLILIGLFSVACNNRLNLTNSTTKDVSEQIERETTMSVTYDVIYLGRQDENLVVFSIEGSNPQQGIIIVNTSDSKDYQVGEHLHIRNNGIMTRSLPPIMNAEQITIATENQDISYELSFAEAESLRSVLSAVPMIDVRTQDEFASGHVPTAKNIPLSELEDKLSDLDRSLPVLVYCRSGARSAKAASILVEHGYTVFDLGGINQYRGEITK